MRLWLPVVAWAAVIFVLSSIPGNDFPKVPGSQTDKLVHGILYSTLGFLLTQGLRGSTSLGRGTLVAVGTGVAIAFGVTDELHQLFTPHRSCDWHDVVADAAGGLVGAVACVMSRRGNSAPAV
jgi:VanZ family protein